MTATAAAPLRVAVIGAGRIGRLHAQLLARSLPGLALGPVFDARAAVAHEVAEPLGAFAVESVDALLGSDCDAVAICSASDSHAELIVAAARAGKAIFCEKPVSLHLSEVDRALAAVREAGVPFQVGFNRRHDPAHASVRAAVADGTVGEPHLVRISSRDPEPPPLDYVRASGGLFLDMTIHDFDMARFVTGSEVVEVFARGTVRIDPAVAEAGDVDTATVSLTHESGCLTTIDNSRRAAYGFDQRVEAFGPGGMAASVNPPAYPATTLTAAGADAPALPHFFLERYRASYEREWIAFAELVRGAAAGSATAGSARTASTPPADPEAALRDARAPLVIGLAAWRSVREGRPVRTEEIAA